jgi:hypothetical protein
MCLASLCDSWNPTPALPFARAGWWNVGADRETSCLGRMSFTPMRSVREEVGAGCRPQAVGRRASETRIPVLFAKSLPYTLGEDARLERSACPDGQRLSLYPTTETVAENSPTRSVGARRQCRCNL